MTTTVASPRARTTFSRLEHVLDLPNLIDIQKTSFAWFKNEGLGETIDDISPIEDYTGRRRVRRVRVRRFAVRSRRPRNDLTQACQHEGPLREQGRARSGSRRLHGHSDDDRVRTFIINDRARHRTQLVRSPGAYHGADDPTKHHGEPDVEPRSWSSSRSTRRASSTAHRPQAEAAHHDVAPGAPAEDPTTGSRSTRPRTRRFSPSSTTRTTSSTRSTRPSTREEEALIEVFGSSGRASRRPSTTRGTSCARCSSTSATT